MVSFLIPNNGASIVRSRLPWMHAITVIFGHHNSHHLHLLKTHGFPLNNNTNIHKPLLLHCSGHHHPVSLPSTFGPLWHEFVSSHQTPSHTPHTFPNLYPQPYPSPTINPINLPKTLANPRQGTNNNTETQIEGRAKRIINKPSYLKDFVWWGMSWH